LRRVVFRIDYFQKFAYLYSHNGSKIKRVKDQRGLNGIINKYVLLIPLGRIRDISSRKILDSATRKRRQKRQLDALEKDNFQDDPHSHLTVVPAKMKVPAFNDTMEDKRKKRKSKTGELFKQRFRRTFAMLLEEAQQEAEAGEPSYNSANVPPSKFPERHFCSVCGFPSNYTCVSCGARYCCVKCLSTHQDTRCLKWTV